MFGTKNPFGPQSDDEKTPENSPKEAPPKDGCLSLGPDQSATPAEPPPPSQPGGSSRGKAHDRGASSATGLSRGGGGANRGRGVRSPIKSPPLSRGSAATASRGSTRGSRGSA
ncbi:uncharacterized protein LOC142355623, partial [Convolutriloba macropyga]|uniref:uncharacterized protein LOC142355623 n=1 Tax=Convolutriloba macropyga TaxID=536237 RepID=UPI003F51DA8A